MLGSEPLWRWRQDRAGARRRLTGLASRSGLALSLDAAVGRLSVGERQRVEIAKALYRGARLLILDEPTAVLTPQEAETLFATLRQLAGDGVGIVFISHKLGEVMRLCGRIAVLRRGRKVLEGSTASLTAAELALAMVGRPVTTASREALIPGPAVLELDTVSLPGGRGRPGLRQASLEVRAHEIVGIAGVAGNGQEELTAIVAGLRLPRIGTVRLRGAAWPGARPGRLRRAGVGRVPEDRYREGLVGDLDVAQNLVLERYASRRFQAVGLQRRRAIRAFAERLIRRFEVATSGPDQKVRMLSGGNAQKLLLARALDGEPCLILADQPTRGLDVGAVAEVHRRLLEARRRGAGILLLSEDLDEILTLADRVAVIHAGSLGPALPARSLGPHELGLMMAGEAPLAA
jgi:general nucleoside transport system ATP-binding protein